MRAKIDSRDDVSDESQLWFGEIEPNKIGYFPKSHIREINVLNSELKYLVPIGALGQHTVDEHRQNHKQQESINKSSVRTHSEGK